MAEEKTFAERPVPKRPQWGWLAWEATVGYIHQQHSPDATLKLQIYPMKHFIGWAASLTWGDNSELVDDQTSFADALNGLWSLVEQNHEIVDSLDAATRRPKGYADDQWLDEATYDVFSRLVNTTDTVFKGDWQIILLYRPIESPEKRIQTRLLADNNAVNRGGSGPTLRDACRSLFHNAAPIYQQYKNQED
jgi:hypothetical protein